MSHSDLSYLQNVRIIQRNLVYIIGIAPSIAEEKIIQSEEFFGQYGTIKKIILNNSPQLIEKVHSCCAYKLINDLTKRYITYSTEQEAYDCIMATDGCVLYDCQIRFVILSVIKKIEQVLEQQNIVTSSYEEFIARILNVCIYII